MFYFDEDHMENGFDAPVASDIEEDQFREGVRHQLGVGVGVGGVLRSAGDGRMLKKGSNGWQRTKHSGSTTTSSTGSYSGDRFSSEATPRSSLYDNCGTLDYLSDGGQSESEEQLAELVPLGMRTHSLSGCKSHHRKKARAHFTDFYKLTAEHLGSGAYASVNTGVSLATGKEFAVKLIDKYAVGHTRSRVMHEVETFNLCKNHPNIVHLHEWFEDSEHFFLVFEKMRGGPLLDHIQRKKFFTEQEACKVTKDIATALKFLHDRGIAHRDVKPENVLCSDIDRVSPVKLCDLDLASKASINTPPKLTSMNSEPDLASPVGSAEFMAPEVVDAFVGDALKYDKRCDMWSLGVIVYIMICGYPPFYGECWRENCGWNQGLACNDCQESLFKRIQRGEFDFPEQEWKNVSEEAKDLICHLLVKNVRDRFTADEVLKHSWVKNGAPNTKLQTPSNLFRNDSTRDVHQIQEHFNVMSRMVAARLSARMEQSEKELDSSEERLDTKCVNAADMDLSENVDVLDGATTILTTASSVTSAAVTPIANSHIEKDGAASATVKRQQPNSMNSELSSIKQPINNMWWNGDAKLALLSNNPQLRPLQQPQPLPQMLMAPAATNGNAQPPMHVSQMQRASLIAYADGLGQLHGMQHQQQHQQHAIIPFHPNQLVNMNGMMVYPHMVPQSLYPNQHLNQPQQLYKFGVLPQQFMAAPPPALPPHLMPAAAYQNQQHLTNNNRPIGYYNSALDRRGLVSFSGAPSAHGMITVRSATALGIPSIGGMMQPTEQLETCQGAMAKQDSKTDLRSCQAHETQVNV